MSQNTPSSSPSSAPSNAQPGTRRKLLVRMAAVVAIGCIAWGAYEWLVASHYENTDNAYVQGNLVQITPQTTGTVEAIMADETDFVQAGHALIKLDPADARVAYQQAEADLAQAVRQVRTLFVNNGSLSAQVTLREAEAARASNDVARATEDLRRRQSLSGNGAVSQEELEHTRSQLEAARAALASARAATQSAREQLQSNRSYTEGIDVASHPSVQAAAARLRQAYLAVQRSALIAPVDGFVAKRSVQVGQRVAPGAQLMTVVPLNQLWVDANFKENQLRGLRIGQPVKLTADLYGSKVEYDGQVAGLGMGTGAAFSLLPAQNATGNWIKVVQRVPVRITLDPEDLKAHPLRVGLSMDVEVDVGKQEGEPLTQASRKEPAWSTRAFEPAHDEVDTMITKIIQDNLAS